MKKLSKDVLNRFGMHKNAQKKTIGEKIRYYRKIHGMSQKKLAELSGVSEASINKYELGTRNPKNEQISLIANALGLEEILFFDISIDTPAKVMSLLFLIDEYFQSSILADLDINGDEAPLTTKMSYVNLDLTFRLYHWSQIKNLYEDIEREDYNSDSEYELMKSMLHERYEKAKLYLMLLDDVKDYPGILNL